jgi:hypothetical protein
VAGGGGRGVFGLGGSCAPAAGGGSWPDGRIWLDRLQVWRPWGGGRRACRRQEGRRPRAGGWRKQAQAQAHSGPEAQAQAQRGNKRKRPGISGAEAQRKGRIAMKKAEALARWRELPEGLNPLAEMIPIPYKAEGSKYGACGIRIDGTPDFIDAVLSNLKDLLDGENAVTRLGLARNEVDGSGIGKALPNKETGAEVCYIRLHERGREGSIASGFNRDLLAATDRYAETIGAK